MIFLLNFCSNNEEIIDNDYKNIIYEYLIDNINIEGNDIYQDKNIINNRIGKNFYLFVNNIKKSFLNISSISSTSNLEKS